MIAVTAYRADVLSTDLDVVFCGVNPATTAVADGHNFSAPSNRFWRAVFAAGFTDRLLAPWEERRLLGYGCGITAFVERPTARADELSRAELHDAWPPFEAKIGAFAPRLVAFLGKRAISTIPDVGPVTWGRQHLRISGSAVWVLPNPSGRNRNFTMAALVESYAELHAALSESRRA